MREFNSIKYYNDSFAATPDATIAALKAITDPKVRIVGGFDRGLELSGLAQAIAEHQADIRKTLIIGNSANRLAEALKLLASITKF